MFHKLSLVALAAPLVHALTLNVPENPVSDGTVTISWTSAPNDPTSFSLELVNEQFHNSFAIANNVFTAEQSRTLVLPVVPVGGGYTLEAVNVGDINQVFASTGGFSIAANPDSGVPSVAPSTGTASATAPASKSPTPGLTSSGSHASASAFGSTVSAPASASNGASGSPSAQTNTVSPSTLNSNNGAVSVFGANKAAFAGVLLSALAGAVVVAL